MRLPLSVSSHSEAETERLGERMAAWLGPGDIVALVGPLGAGKTCLARGILRGLGLRGPVASPTFALAREYQGGRIPVRHIDLYRLTPPEVAELDWRELFYSPAVTLVEWADRAEGYLPDQAYRVRLEPGGDHASRGPTATDDRRITITGPRPALKRPDPQAGLDVRAMGELTETELPPLQVGAPAGPPPRMVLAIDTSTESRSLALIKDTSLSERFWGPEPGALPAEDLSGAVRSLIDAAGIALGDLDLIAVASGPGSFTGVKVGLAAVKALAYALRVPLIAVSTLDILAAGARRTVGLTPVLATIDARRGEVFGAAYAGAATAEPLPLADHAGPYLTQPAAEAAEALLDAIDRSPPRLALAGSGSELVRPALERRLSRREPVQAAPELLLGPQFPRAGDLALIARLRWLREPRGSDPFALQPLYLREPSISRPRGAGR